MTNDVSNDMGLKQPYDYTNEDECPGCLCEKREEPYGLGFCGQGDYCSCAEFGLCDSYDKGTEGSPANKPEWN